MLIVGTGFGWLAMRLDQARKQKEAVDALVVLGLTVSYDYQFRDGNPLAGSVAPAGTFWRKWLGDDFFDRVVAVKHGGVPIRDENMYHFDALRSLEHLNLSGARITDGGVAHLGNLTELKSLDLWGSKITDKGMKSLQRMTKLEDLWLGTA